MTEIDKLPLNIDTMAFSYREMSDLGFDPEFTQDYLEQIRNIIAVIEKSNESTDQINSNTESIETIKPKVASNTERLDIVEPKVSKNTSDISTNKSSIDSNSQAISGVSSDLSNHKSDSSAHGVSGSNVGSENYAEESKGGAVLLAGAIEDLTQIARPDIEDAPSSYSQFYAQSVTALTNENKAKINEIVLKINEIIAGQVSAKQMAQHDTE
ncbi:MAG: hypothetical protein GY782_03610 [Gammaproteobacteria bacterium]|nr:hypothetical protein [Gammaproteobacteria bacterium]